MFGPITVQERIDLGFSRLIAALTGGATESYLPNYTTDDLADPAPPSALPARSAPSRTTDTDGMVLMMKGFRTRAKRRAEGKTTIIRKHPDGREEEIVE